VSPSAKCHVLPPLSLSLQTSSVEHSVSVHTHSLRRFLTKRAFTVNELTLDSYLCSCHNLDIGIARSQQSIPDSVAL